MSTCAAALANAGNLVLDVRLNFADQMPIYRKKERKMSSKTSHTGSMKPTARSISPATTNVSGSTQPTGSGGSTTGSGNNGGSK